MSEPKYKNYTELAAAFKSGELDKHYYMMLDKGGSECSLSYFNEDASDEENDRKSNECQDLFNYEYDEHIEALFEALGIRAEWC